MLKDSYDSVRSQGQAPHIENSEHTAKAPPKSVSGEKLLDNIVAVLNQHVVLPKYAAETLALWALHTHTFDAWQWTPRLVLTSPIPECGKTRTLKILQALMPGSRRFAYATEAGLRRAFNRGGTILLDEADTFFSDKPHLKPAINAGCERGSAALLTTTDKKTGKISEENLSLWAPLAIAGIGDKWMWKALNTRSLVFNLQKKLPGETVEDWDTEAEKVAKRIGRMAEAWGEQNLEALDKAKPELPPDLHNRQRDNWKPLIAVADAAGGKWSALARKIAVALCGGKPELEYAEQVLAETRVVFRKGQMDKIRSSDLVEALQKQDDEDAWAISDPKVLAAILRGFGIPSAQQMKFGKTGAKGYKREWFEDAWARYLEPETGEVSAVSAKRPSRPSPASKPRKGGQKQ